LTDSSAQPKYANDDFYPAPDLGFVWFRKVAGFWSASGLVNHEVFRDAASVERLLDCASDKLLGHDEQLVYCIEFVTAKFAATFDGECGQQRVSKTEAEGRWRPGKDRGERST
jgi:hypothetical protein